MIKKCAFGSMVIGDQTYGSDLIIFPDGRVAGNWWRQSGHRLTWEDIRDLLAADPNVIVVGTGIFGRMRVNDDEKDRLSESGVELVAERTKTAAETFNRRIQTSGNVGGCFHLTC